MAGLRDGLAAAFADCIDDCLNTFDPATGTDKLRPAVGQAPGDRLPDSTRRAVYQSDLA